MAGPTQTDRREQHVFRLSTGWCVLMAGHTPIPFSPLLFIAPRGLITILLFLSIEPVQAIPLINESLIIQVIVLTAFVMMFGLMKNKHTKDKHRLTNKII